MRQEPTMATGRAVHVTDPAALPWRTGRKVARTVYAVVGDEPSEADTLIGVMDTPELAAAAVRAHNAEVGLTLDRDA